MKKITLNQEQRYALADAIANSYSVCPELAQRDAKRVYAIIRNEAQFPITRNGKPAMAKLSDCDEDTASHVTRLTMRRLTRPAMAQKPITSWGE